MNQVTSKDGIISVIVCTHNRCEGLNATIRSLQVQNLPASDYEIIVVDNNSTDQTRLVVEKLAKRSAIPLRYFFEGELGLSRARNTGISHARSDIVAFIDDDAVADRSWLSHLGEVYKEEKDAICVGGKIMLQWTVDKPDWWKPVFDKDFGLDLGTQRKELKYPFFPYGTNISFKRCTLLDYGGFSTSLGRKGSRLLGWEETDMCLRIEKHGGRIYYQPSALVYHVISPNRVKRSFIIKRSFWHGMSHARLEHYHFGQDLIQEKARSFARHLVDWLKGKELPEYSGLNVVFYKVGYLIQSFLSRIYST